MGSLRPPWSTTATIVAANGPTWMSRGRSATAIDARLYVQSVTEFRTFIFVGEVDEVDVIGHRIIIRAGVDSRITKEERIPNLQVINRFYSGLKRV